MQAAKDAVDEALVVLALWVRESDAGDNELGRAVVQEGTGGVQPLAFGVVQGESREVEWGDRDAGNYLVPVQADLEEALEWPWCPKVLDDGEDVEDALFETEVAPSQSTVPESVEDNGAAHFGGEAGSAQGSVDGLGLEHLAGGSWNRGGRQGAVHLSEPDREESRPCFEVGDVD